MEVQKLILDVANAFEQGTVLIGMYDIFRRNVLFLLLIVLASMRIYEFINPAKKSVSPKACDEDGCKNKGEDSSKPMSWDKAALNMLESWSRVLFGNRTVNSVSWAIDYTINKPNPLVQFFYLVIAGGGFYIYVTRAMMNPSYMPGPYISGYHCYTASIVMIVCYYSFYMASFTDPGVIPDKQAAKVAKKRYPFDEVMYKRDNDCKTCGFEKPARSKHCAVCNVCIEKFDHHCIWINNCVGRKNYRYFLTFLGLHCIICLYGAVVGLLIFLGEKERKDAAGLVFVNTVTGERAAPTLWTHVKFFFLNEERHLGVVVSICAIITPVLCGFFGYHLRLAWNNETTNESYKRDAISAGIQF